MARLVNMCRWSSSREGTFNECKKKYWYSYYGSWEGWPKTPYDSRPTIDPLANYLYTLKNMQPACMFMGSIVHKAIELALKEGERSKKIPPLSYLIETTSKLFDTGVEESKKKLWKTHPKRHTNLLEEYYQHSLSKDFLSTLREKAVYCATNWHESPIAQNVAFNEKAKWLGIETPLAFEVEKGVEAIVVYDFFLSWNATTLIFDWKTGKSSPKIESQLFAYAIAANTIYQTPYDAMILSPFYLAEGKDGYKKYSSLCQETLTQIKENIIIGAKKMLSLHPSPDRQGNVPIPEPFDFSYTENRMLCQRCPFQEICQKADYQTLSCRELTALVH